MEKKVALIWLFAIALGFWSVTMLFYMGNPFAQTEGTYRYSISDVSVSVPLDWLHDLVNLLNYQNKVQLSASYSPVTVHVGNFTTNLAGKNWDLFITRIANHVIAGILAYGISSPYSYYSVPATNYIYALGTIALSIVSAWAIIRGLRWSIPKLYHRIQASRSVT